MCVCTLESEDFYKLLVFIFTIAPFLGDLMANASKSGSCMCFIVGFFSKPNKTPLFCHIGPCRNSEKLS